MYNEIVTLYNNKNINIFKILPPTLPHDIGLNILDYISDWKLLVEFYLDDNNNMFIVTECYDDDFGENQTKMVFYCGKYVKLPCNYSSLQIATKPSYYTLKYIINLYKKMK